MVLPYLFDVVLPTIAPVLARPGEVVAVSLGHPSRTVVTMEGSGVVWTLLRVGRPDLAAVLALVRAGVLVERTVGATAVVARAAALQTAVPETPPVLAAASEIPPRARRARRDPRPPRGAA